jgi:hypothetical protein
VPPCVPASVSLSESLAHAPVVFALSASPSPSTSSTPVHDVRAPAFLLGLDVDAYDVAIGNHCTHHMFLNFPLGLVNGKSTFGPIMPQYSVFQTKEK